MTNSFTAYELKSWVDEIPSSFLNTPFPTTHPLFADANCRLVVQEVTPDVPIRFILRVQVNNNCLDPVLAAFKQEEPGAVSAWCAVSQDEPVTAEAIRIALKATVES